MATVVVSTRVVLPEGMHPAAVHIDGERIGAVTEPGAVSGRDRVTDVGDLVVMPGGVDPHVHINEPGRTDWEGFVTATRAAAAGGITTVVDMPLNSDPVTICLDALERKRAAAEGKLWVDCGVYGGLVPGNAGELPAMLDAGVLGIKAFLVHSGIDAFPNASESDLGEAAPALRRRGIPLLVHAELDAAGAPAPSDPRRYADYLASRPRAWEQAAIDRLIDYCRDTRVPVHIVHLSNADALDAIRAAKAEGLPLTVETCPHYLYFASEEIPDGDPRFKCAPPIRERENNRRLWEALGSGTIDFVASDHSPCLPAMKQLESGNLFDAWGGISSLQLGLSIVWTLLREDGGSPERLAQWMSGAPARRVGLESWKGRIVPGMDADLVIWDPDARWTVRGSELEHRHPVTPYEDCEVFGRVRQTWLRGRPVLVDGRWADAPRGRMVRGG